MAYEPNEPIRHHFPLQSSKVVVLVYLVKLMEKIIIRGLNQNSAAGKSTALEAGAEEISSRRSVRIIFSILMKLQFLSLLIMI